MLYGLLREINGAWRKLGGQNWLDSWRKNWSFLFLLLNFFVKTDALSFVVRLCRIHTWKSSSVIYFLVVQLLAVSVALVDIYGNRLGLVPWRASCWGHLLSVVEHLGLYVVHHIPKFYSNYFFFPFLIPSLWSFTVQLQIWVFDVLNRNLVLQTELDIQSSHTWAFNFEFLVKSLGWFIPWLVWCHNILGSQENGHKMYASCTAKAYFNS